ncbi:hypothetical protein MKW98_007577 [Papaver atlanticum]|uniref:Glutathione S-transferase n=1 Tax=Papaver atlanticum TaxID=357466 RepID=A0AAD4SKQ1_9MAGN|nr:hypothetical protein MKW98_007577 [Papaver atlanticum]
MAKDEVKLLGYWASPLALRVEWALKIKGIQYEYIDEDLMNKSPMLLQYNPVHKKIPVLSLVIIEYIDETWKENPIFSEDPYEKAQARFWAKFADDKCQPSILNAFLNQGEELENAVKETGFADAAIGWIPFWTGMTEEIICVNLVDEENMPLLRAWFEDVLNVEILKERLPPRDKTLAHCKMFRESLLSTAAAATAST